MLKSFFDLAVWARESEGAKCDASHATYLCALGC